MDIYHEACQPDVQLCLISLQGLNTPGGPFWAAMPGKSWKLGDTSASLTSPLHLVLGTP